MRLLSARITTGSVPLPSTRPAGLAAAGLEPGRPLDEAVEELQRELVARALEASGGVLSVAAARLSVERTRLSRLARRLGLPTPKSG